MKYLATASLLAISLFASTTFAAGRNDPPAPAKPTSGHMHQDRTDHGKMDGHADHGKPKDAAGEFSGLDANKDGKLSKAELRKHKLAPHFGMLDVNKNGTLSPTEFAAGKAM